MGLYPEVCEAQPLGVQPAGPVDQLKQRKSILQGELDKVNAALDALEKNPEVANIIQLVGKALR